MFSTQPISTLEAKIAMQQFSMLVRTLFLDSAVACARTYEGGCGNWDDKSLGVNYQDRAYTVKECHDLCKAQSDCGGFFMGTSTNHCLLARSGCTDDDNSNWNYYDMSTCSYSTGTSYF